MMDNKSIEVTHIDEKWITSVFSKMNRVIIIDYKACKSSSGLKNECFSYVYRIIDIGYACDVNTAILGFNIKTKS